MVLFAETLEPYLSHDHLGSLFLALLPHPAELQRLSVKLPLENTREGSVGVSDRCRFRNQIGPVPVPFFSSAVPAALKVDRRSTI